MAKKQQQEDEVLVDVGQSLSNAEKYFEENKQTISIIVIALVVLVGGYFAYNEYYKKPLEKEAQVAIFSAQQSLEADSLQAALDGTNGNMGFLDVADEFGGTKAGNLANYYAGVAYLNLGQFENAIEYLDKFSSDDPILSVIAKGAMGDAFLELNQPEEALDYYTKAVNGEDNNFVVPIYLQKAAILAEAEGKLDVSKKHFTRIKKDFPKSPEALSADKYLARLDAKMAK